MTSTMPQSSSWTPYEYASLLADISPQTSFDTNNTVNADFRIAIIPPLGLTEVENHEFMQVLWAVKESFGADHATRAFRTAFRLGSLAVESVLSAAQVQPFQQDLAPKGQGFTPPRPVAVAEYNTLSSYSASTASQSSVAHHDITTVKIDTIPTALPEEGSNSMPSGCTYPMRTGYEQTCRRSVEPFKRKRGLREHLVLVHGYSVKEAEEEASRRWQQV